MQKRKKEGNNIQTKEDIIGIEEDNWLCFK